MLPYISNKLNYFRSNLLIKVGYEINLKCTYLIRNMLGYCRGVLVCLAGKIKCQGPWRPLIIGARTDLLIRPGCSIVLRNDSNKKSDNVYYNNPIFLTAATIGLRPHYWALDPPANNTTRIELLQNAELILEKNTAILSGCYISASNAAKIYIGQNSYISQEVIINSRYSVNIGRNVLIGYQSMIMDYNAHTVIYNEAMNNQPENSKKSHDIVIGDNVWIGAKVTILKGVTIGAGSIIGANSCVVSDIPENTLAVGNPAKIVRKNISWVR